jgi:hypothetical protein
VTCIISRPRGGVPPVVGVTSVARGKGESRSVGPPSPPREPSASPREEPGPPFYRCKERIQMYNGGVAMR